MSCRRFVLLLALLVVVVATNAAPRGGAFVPMAKLSAELTVNLNRYKLEAGTIRAPGGTMVFPCLFHRPAAARVTRLPVVVYLPGSGEIGSDLVKQFRQRTIFERVASSAFQKRHPCFFLALSPPDGTRTMLGGLPGRPSPLQTEMLDALTAFLRSQKSPKADLNRIYLTGLSYGGNGSYALALARPGFFAAVVPVASLVQPTDWLSPDAPGAWWHFYNADDYRRHGIDEASLTAFARHVASLGGEFRIGTYPDTGHNAWDKAWREDAVWDWMFAKTADGKGAENSLTKPSAVALDLKGATCSASVEGRDEKSTPAMAADGLDATAYVSLTPVARGGWWQIAFAEPLAGKITILSGTRAGKDRLVSGRVEVSSDGDHWTRAGTFSRMTGVCAFSQKTKIRFLRVVAETSQPEILTLREVKVEP